MVTGWRAYDTETDPTALGEAAKLAPKHTDSLRDIAALVPLLYTFWGHQALSSKVIPLLDHNV